MLLCHAQAHGENIHRFPFAERFGDYNGELDEVRLKKRGIHVIDCKLVSLRSQSNIDEKLLVSALLSLT
jgi:hypothetical protein